MARRRGPRRRGDGDDDESTPLVARGRGSTTPATVTRVALLVLVAMGVVGASTETRRRFSARVGVFKKGLKTVTGAASGVANAWSKTGDAAWTRAENLSKNARKKVGGELTAAMQSGHQEIFKQYDEASGWSQGAANQVARGATGQSCQVLYQAPPQPRRKGWTQ